MRVIFVGVHNKPNKKPLDSSTKTGKLIDRIINKLECKVIKTNLFDVDYLPKSCDKHYHALNWYKNKDANIDDVFVLLGAEVQKNFYCVSGFQKIVRVHHPASKRSHIAMDEYVIETSKQINSLIL